MDGDDGGLRVEKWGVGGGVYWLFGVVCERDGWVSMRVRGELDRERCLILCCVGDFGCAREI